MEKKENQNPEKKIPSIGILLKTARERKGQSLEAITNVLCIRLKHLQAIEKSNYEELPGKTYAIGFVKAYAEHLGLDGDEVVRLFKEEVIELKKKQELYILETGSEASVPSYFTVFIALVLASLVYFAWNNFSNQEGRDIDIIDDIPPEIAKVVKHQPETPEIIEEETTKKAVTNVVKEKSGNNVFEKEIKNIGVVAGKTTKEIEPLETVKVDEKKSTQSEPDNEQIIVPVVDLEQEKAVIINEEEAKTESIETVEPQPEIIREPQVYGQENTNSRILLRANAESWVHIVGKRETGDDIIFISKLFYKDDIYSLPNRTDLLLDTGNAGGLDVFIDGLKVEPLGTKGAVKRKISLSPEDLLKKTIDFNLNQN